MVAASPQIRYDPSVSFTDSSHPERAKDGAESRMDEYGPILSAPEPAGLSERVNAAAVEAIARMVADCDSSQDQVEATMYFRERTRGVLALVYELRGGCGE